MWVGGPLGRISATAVAATIAVGLSTVAADGQSEPDHSTPPPTVTGPVVHGHLYLHYATGHPRGHWSVIAQRVSGREGASRGGETAVSIGSPSGGGFAMRLEPGVYRVGAEQSLPTRRREYHLCDARSLTIKRGVTPMFVAIRCRISSQRGHGLVRLELLMHPRAALRSALDNAWSVPNQLEQWGAG
jgi:hypothetical protein